jgi:CRISPR-associated exonuclease Cas4
MKPTATHINYYFTCKRKLWWFTHNITCEHDSETVKIGKLYHEEKEEPISIDNIKLDGFRDGKVFELKKKNTATKAAQFQVLYYLHVLKEHGIETSGLIKYKENNRIEEVQLTKKLQEELKEAIKEVKTIALQDKPPQAKRIKYCKGCSYYELCWS